MFFFSISRSITRTPYPEHGFDVINHAIVSGGSDGSDGSGGDWTAESRGDGPWSWWSWWNGHGGIPKRKRPAEEQNTAADVHPDTTPRPETAVTYLIKGCTPKRIPFNLSPCSALDGDVQQAADRITSTRTVYYVPPSTWPATLTDTDVYL